MARKVAAVFDGNLRNRNIGVLGLAFKPNTDDMREAPSIPLITALQDLGAKVRAYDPVSMEQAKLELPDITYCDSPYSCAAKCGRTCDRNGMGTVPSSGFESVEKGNGSTRDRRPAERLSPGRNRQIRLHICKRWTGRYVRIAVKS